MILGIDEVGRGPWAGPLVVGAVVLSENTSLRGLTDSKKLSAKKRIELDQQIREEALAYGLGWVHADELDIIGLSEALRVATIRAVEGITVPYHQIIIDGTINFLKDTTKGQYVTTMPKADLLIPAVSAASIIAKVARDVYMERQDSLYPEYGFATHVGYGTAKHQQALREYGITMLHRTSFAPIKKILNQSTPHSASVRSYSSKAIGDRAEEMTASWLVDQGFKLLERNWKTKHCEIDCIATKAGVVYFVEVKYRSTIQQGGGISAITKKKLQQMRFAAEYYATRHSLLQDKLKLAVVAVGPQERISLIEIE